MEWLIELLKDHPFWVLALLFVVYIIFTGDVTLWKYEADIPADSALNGGEVELSRKKKKGGEIEVEINNVGAYINQQVDVYLQQQLIFSISPPENGHAKMDIEKPLDIPEPNEGDIVQLKVAEEIIFSGVLSKRV